MNIETDDTTYLEPETTQIAPVATKNLRHANAQALKRRRDEEFSQNLQFYGNRKQRKAKELNK